MADHEIRHEGRELDGTELEKTDKKLIPNWKKKCEVCGASPIVPMTGLCGPCTFGEADTANGNW